MTHWSLNEIEATSKRAARGAGRSWGMAEEAGKAVRSLHETGLPGVKLLAALLHETDNLAETTLAPTRLTGVWQAGNNSLCPIATGATLCDIAAEIAAGREVTTGPVTWPLLVLPFARALAGMGATAIRLRWADVSVDALRDGVLLNSDFDALFAARAESLTCRRIETCARASAVQPLHNVAADDWERLNAFAFRTFAPESEASRRKGAGSSLPDND
ncbi:MAG: DUF3726 domain-containing protein [Nitratireductor sp.]